MKNRTPSVSTIVIRALFIIILGMCAVPMPGYKTESWIVAGVVIGIFVLIEKFATKSEDRLW